MRSKIKLIIHGTTEILIAKAEYRTGCILPGGRWLNRSEYTHCGTMGCHFCGNLFNLIIKDTWYGGRICCPGCKPPVNYAVCVFCRKNASFKIRRYSFSERECYMFYYCVEHYQQQPDHNTKNLYLEEVA